MRWLFEKWRPLFKFKLFSSCYLAEHNEGLLYPGEDPEGDVGGPALAEGVPVRDIQPQSRGPLSNLD